MNRLRRRREQPEADNVHRWLVSYADYMTLMFALFVVLYAMAMVNEKQFDSITESFGRVFQTFEDKPKNLGHGDSVLMVNSKQSPKKIYGDGILPEAGPELVEDEKILSNISDEQVGSNLTSLERELHTALFDLIESGFSKLQIDGDWLEIELNSGLLFPSGSSSATNSAETILAVIYDVIGDANNFIRIRGYTDNQPINNEIYSSNWELSVFRATAILRSLEKVGINPARMAIEGYGQYYPSADNSTLEGRTKNRKVVIAISKFALNNTPQVEEKIFSINDIENVISADEVNTGEILAPDNIKVIRLEGGGIRITSREDNGINTAQ